uniref:Cog7 n=1 Tax=Kluyveromyces lactis TaxID=28985 RepID=UPI00051FF3F9|nr:Chain A, Cog7 [Kluyveromyces lactis]4U6U_C Chain C, Cog7 [Kluyveromyces lactis]
MISGANDPLLDMFFDDDFVPQAFVDILLSSFQTSQLEELKTNCSSLLSKMDYYSGHITKELESTIQVLQKPAELIIY